MERTQQEIHGAVAGIQPKQPPSESAPAVESRPIGTTTVRSESSNHSADSEPLDASRTRLENLKRRLSEKLQTQQTDRARAPEPTRKESHDMIQSSVTAATHADDPLGLSNNEKYCVFQRATVTFGLLASAVREVAFRPSITVVPDADPLLAGHLPHPERVFAGAAIE